MTVKERLLQEIEQMPDDSLAELLDAALLIKQGTVFFRIDTLMKILLSKERKILIPPAFKPPFWLNLQVALLLMMTNSIKQRQYEGEISEEEKNNIIQSHLDYEAGDYMTLEEAENSFPSNLPTPERKKSRVKALQGWFEKTVPAPADFDEDEAKWEYLKVKHNL